MRLARGIAVGSMALGVVLVVGAGAVKWVAAPALVKVPTSVKAVTVAEGQSQVFVLAQQKVSTVNVIATRTVNSDTKATTSLTSVFNETLCLRAATGTATPDAAGCVSSADPSFIEKDTDRVAFNRETGLAVPDSSRFNTSVNGDTSVVHVGLGYTFPVDTAKKSYPYFDTVALKAYPMNYQATEKIEGLSLYKFVQVVPSTPIKIDNLLPGTYSDTTTVWVQPTTGVIVKGSQQIVQKFTTGGTVFSGTLTFNDASVHSQAQYAKKQLKQVHLIRIWIPLALLVLGLILIVVGFVVFRRRREVSPAV